MKWRRYWLLIHRWVALTAGLVFVVIGLSGSILVFQYSIDGWLNPWLNCTEANLSHRPLTPLIRAAEKEYPDLGTADAIWMHPLGACVVIFNVDRGPHLEADSHEVAVDPDTGKVLAKRVWGSYLTSWMFQLHFTLLLGPAGKTAIGIFGIFLALSVASGLILWWPLIKKGVRIALGVRRHKLTFDLHKSVGALSIPILLLEIFTGVYYIFPAWYQPIIVALGTETPWPTLPDTQREENPPLVDADQARSLAFSRFPNTRLHHIELPQADRSYFVISLRQPNEVNKSRGETLVWVDAHVARIVTTRDAVKLTAADHFVMWQLPLHNGEAFGLAGRWAVFASGLAPAALYITGLLLYFRRGAPQKRQLSTLQERK